MLLASNVSRAALPHTTTRTTQRSKKIAPRACLQCASTAALPLHSLVLLRATAQGSDGGGQGPGWPPLSPGAPRAATDAGKRQQQQQWEGGASTSAGARGDKGSGGSSSSSSGGDSGGGGGGEEDDDDGREYNVGVRLALRALAFYRNVISPLMPPRCRYVPSCSNYSIQAFKEFGVWKGGVLTAWRLARCQPLGGKAWSYDPPSWPPVGLEFMYQEESYVLWLVASNVAVVAAAYALTHGFM